MKTSTKVLFGCLTLFVLFIWTGICISLDWPMILVYIGDFIILPAGLVAGFFFDEAQQEKTKQIYTCDELGTLKIISPHHSKFKRIIHVKPAHTIQYKYNPATLEYTGVTIGGTAIAVTGFCLQKIGLASLGLVGAIIGGVLLFNDSKK